MMAESSEEEAAGSGRRYGIDELVQIRTSASFVLLNLDKLSADAETSTILNLPQQAKENRNFSIRTSELANLNKRAPLVERPVNNSTRRRAGSRSIMASGFDEDEDRVIYRGHPSRKDIRETQWQLRRREASERSSQPLDAPTDSLAQKDDNFKAFFQAVRSPTHVRVTAGGRIVPNTRAHPPPQPVFKWNNEQRLFELPRRQSSPDDGQTPVFYQEGVDLPLTDQRLHGIFSAAGAPYFAVPPSMQALGGGAGENNATENIPIALRTTMPAETEEASVHPHSLTSHQGIQISPPENFDLSRPYWFHDRWIVPGSEASQHQPMLPVNLTGNPGMMHPMYGYLPGAFAPHGAPPGMFFPPPNHAMGVHQPGQQLQYAFPPMMYPGPQPLGNIANGTPAQQAASGVPIFPPQLLQYLEDPNQRLARCREDLKKIENDLENNAHQIDKPSKLLQRSLCVAEIHRLEAILNHNGAKQTHLAAGSGMPPKNQVPKSGPMVRSEESSDRNIQRPIVVDSNLTTSTPTPQVTIENDTNRSATGSVDQSAEQHPKDDSREQSKVEPQVGTSSVQDKSRNRARLAAAAATAVFQPRSHQLPKLQTREEKDADNGAVDTDASAESPDEKTKQSLLEARMLANSVDWSIPPGMLNPTHMGPPVPYSHMSFRPRHNEAMGHQKTYPYMPIGAHVPAAPRVPIPLHMTATPYLRGIQQIGNGEYTYERQLTDDELRARCLYFGKAPRELQRGLPKYNGRDFFPPSPAKALARPSKSGEPAVQAKHSDPFRDIDYSRTNQGLKEDGNDEDDISINSWGEEVKSKKMSKAFSASNTLPRMKATKREDRSPFTDNANVPIEEDQDTIASDRQSIRQAKRITAENKVSSSSFLQDMLKNPRYTSSFGASLDRKESSSDSFSGKSRSFEDRIRSSTQASSASMAAPLSGTITSATAKGLLPQYHGSATASLAPNSESPDRFGSKLFARFSSTSDSQEQQSPPRVSRNEENRAAPSRLAAAEYLRSLANKEQHVDRKASPSLPNSFVSEDDKTSGDC